MTFLTGMETSYRPVTYITDSVFMTFLTGMETIDPGHGGKDPGAFMTFLTGMETRMRNKPSAFTLRL